MAYQQLKLDNQICFRLYTAARLITQAYNPFFQELGITYPQYLVLMILWEQDNRVISEITDQLGLETNTVTPLLQRMEKQGLILRTKSQIDSRQRIVSLTKEGKKMEEAAKDIPRCLSEQIIGNGISWEDILALAPLLDKINNAMRTKANAHK